MNEIFTVKRLYEIGSKKHLKKDILNDSLKAIAANTENIKDSLS